MESACPMSDCLLPIREVRCRAYTIPTDSPEADGTFVWHSTTMVIVEIDAGEAMGLGYSYTSPAAVSLVRETLGPALIGRDAFSTPSLWSSMCDSVRNLGRSGIAATAISAVDTALWDLKARALNRPLVTLLGAARDAIPIYGSGGFTTYSEKQTAEQLERWVGEDGCRWVKIKIGSHPDVDPLRVEAARRAIGPSVGLFVDANGACSEKQALELARRFDANDVSWFEEPVSTDDIVGLASLRHRVPARMEIAAGEYGFTPDDFRRLLEHRAVDVLQADVTRCGGVTGFLRVAALCDAFHIPLSAHCAPALHLHVAASVPRLRHQEWFHDHVRIEQLFFDGAPLPADGAISPDLTRTGHGLQLLKDRAEPYAVNA